MTDPHALTKLIAAASDIAEALEDGQVTADEVLKLSLDALELAEPLLRRVRLKRAPHRLIKAARRHEAKARSLRALAAERAE